MNELEFLKCEKCGKKLITRRYDGLWYFAYGKALSLNDPPIEFYIFGSIKMKCFRSTCGHWNEFSRFPEV